MLEETKDYNWDWKQENTRLGYIYIYICWWCESWCEPLWSSKTLELELWTHKTCDSQPQQWGSNKPKKYHIIPHPIIKFEQLFRTQTLVFSRTCLRIRASQECQTWFQLMCGFADESHFWHRAWQSSPVHHTWGRSGIPILDGESKPSSFFRVG